MKNLIISTSIALMTLAGNHVLAQEIDEEKMQRDIQVAETVLSSLVRGNSHEWVGVRGSSNSSRYVEGYGVILHLPPGGIFSAGFSAHPAKVIINRRVYRDDISEDEEVVHEEFGEEEPDHNSDDPVYQEEGIGMVKEKSNEELIEIIKTFLLDYGDMIGQLREEEKIMVIEGQSPFQVIIAGDAFSYSTQEKSKLSAEIMRGDLMDFKSGKISREEALEKIVVTTPEEEVLVHQDRELLASIFDRLYRPDLSKTFYIRGKVEYDNLTDFGVIYNLNMGFGAWRGTAQLFGSRAPRAGMGRDQTEEEIRNSYPQFEKQLLENILDYGRTLNSLPKEEYLVVHALLEDCQGCGIPDFLEVTIKSAFLMEYGEGKISREAALEKMAIKKGNVQ